MVMLIFREMDKINMYSIDISSMEVCINVLVKHRFTSVKGKKGKGDSYFVKFWSTRHLVDLVHEGKVLEVIYW